MQSFGFLAAIKLLPQVLTHLPELYGNAPPPTVPPILSKVWLTFCHCLSLHASDCVWRWRSLYMLFNHSDFPLLWIVSLSSLLGFIFFICKRSSSTLGSETFGCVDILGLVGKSRDDALLCVRLKWIRWFFYKAVRYKLTQGTKVNPKFFQTNFFCFITKLILDNNRY